MDGNVTFRSAVMGGFNREDVMNYIGQRESEHRKELEQMVRANGEAEDQIRELRGENERLKAELDELRGSEEARLEELHSMAESFEELKRKSDRADALERELEMVRDQLQATQTHADAQQKELLEELEGYKAEKAEMEQVMEQAKERLEDQARRLDEQARQVQELQGQTTEMMQNSTAYQDLCGRIGQIEMDMRFRTLRMEQETRETMQAQAEAARATYEKVVSSANDDAVEVRRLAQEQLEQFQDDVSGTSAQVSEAVAKALEEVNTVKELLERLDSNLGQRMAAVNEIQLGEPEIKRFSTKVVAQAEEDMAARDRSEQEES